MLPKGRISFDELAARDVTAMMSHVNSSPRKSLMGLSPIDMFLAAYGKRGTGLLEGLGIEKVAPDDILLKPELLNREREKRGEEPIGIKA